MSPLPCTPMDLDLARFYARKTGPTIDYYRVKIGKPDRGKAMPSLKIRDVNIHYRVLGERGPWLALITGGRRGFNEFIPLAEKIAAHGVRVVLHDRRNTGASDVVIQADPSGDLGEEEIWTDDLYELLGTLEARPAGGGAGVGGRRLGGAPPAPPPSPAPPGRGAPFYPRAPPGGEFLRGPAAG